MTTCRFFVSNLSSNATEKDLTKLFKKYGTIDNVELKIKESLVDADDKKVLGFVTVQIEPKEAQKCIQKLNHHVLHGQNILVALAKESFLQRLKKEREETQTGGECVQFEKTNTIDVQSKVENNSSRQNKRKTFDIYEDLKDNEVEPELMITKKRAASSMQNGKIVIHSQVENEKPLHIIEKRKVRKNQTSENKTLMKAEQKRKESMNKRQQDYKQKKCTIQNALKNLDQYSNSKKITFNENESETENHSQADTINRMGKTSQLFSDDDKDSNDENLKLKSFLTGHKGAKLAKLRATQSSDPRFHIDENFVDSEDDNSNCELSNNDKRKCKDVTPSNLNEDGFQKKHKEMIRYDPNNKEHQNIIEKSETETKGNKELSKKKNAKHKENSRECNSDFKVSKETFYIVSDTLQDSFKKPSEGFSLLSMFGDSQHIEERQEQLKQLSNEKILVKNTWNKNDLTRNPFHYDSSSSEVEDEGDVVVAKDDNNVNKKFIKDKEKRTSKNKLKLCQKPFFIITKNDIRLKEGAKFFRRNEDGENENYEEVREHLKQIVKRKIAKTKKNFIKAGYKMRKKQKKRLQR